jgi:hypothetical protein
METASSSETTAIATVAARQPASWPIRVASGAPATSATEPPTAGRAPTRSLASGRASRISTGAATEKKTPWASAARPRPAR